MVRIELAKNNPTKKPKAVKVGILTKFNFDDLIKFASSKIGYNKKKLRIFVGRNSNKVLPGEEITKETNLEEILNDGILLVISKGENYKGKNVSASNVKLDHSLISKMTKPPRFPLPGIDEEIKVHKSSHVDESIEIYDKIPKVPEKVLAFNGQFPIFYGNVFHAIKEAIKSNPGIVCKFMGNYYVFDYTEDTIFPPIIDWNTAVQRECRGLIISAKTGEVISRRFHKFFNVNQNSESREETINFMNAKYFEKVDGCLVSPVLFDEKITWISRKVPIDEISKFVSDNYDSKFNVYLIDWIANGWTPLFEWCPYSRRYGILDHDQTKLILICLRNNKTGEYNYNIDWEYDKVKQFDLNETKWNEVRKWVNEEGIVIKTKEDKLYKLKSDWYVNMASALKNGGKKNYLIEMVNKEKSLKNIPKYYVWKCLLENHDDVISTLTSKLIASERNQVLEMLGQIDKNIKSLDKEFDVWIKDLKKGGYNDDVIVKLAHSAGWSSDLIEAYINKQNSLLKPFFLEVLKPNKVGLIESLLDIEWDSENVKLVTDHNIMEIVTFEKSNKDLVNHVCNEYLPKKVSKMLDIKEVSNDTIINISRFYSANEGKIMGMWEKFTNQNIWHLRIDLQPPIKGKLTPHNGNEEYALLLVQYGLYDNDPKKQYGNLAGVFIPTEYNIKYSELFEAMKMSFGNRKLIKMRRKNTFDRNLRVYCDLDGVLVDFEKGVIDVTGKTPDQQSVSKMWNRILSVPAFFEHLNWTIYGKDMWEQIKTISSQNPTILTGLPFSAKKKVQTQKEKWCSLKLGEEFKVITCMSADKYKYAASNHILIDDRIKNGLLWKAYGGIFIHHVNPLRTLYELRYYFGQIKKTKKELKIDYEMFLNNRDVEIIIDRWPIINTNLVSLDVEWDPDMNSDHISLVQLGTEEKNYLVDMVKCNDVIKERLYELLGNNKIMKIGFGLEVQDLDRLQTSIRNVIDLQEIALHQIESQWEDTFISLGNLCKIILNKKMNKSKMVQAGSWAHRPLSKAQIDYVANDVAVLLDIYKIMKEEFECYSKDLVFITKSKTKEQHNEFNPDLPHKVKYSGIFITPKSRELILENFKPIHPNIYSDHVTLAFQPKEKDLRGLEVGKMIKFKLVGNYSGSKVQAVKVLTEYGERHITISTAIGVNPVESNNIKDEEWKKVDDIELYGIIGIKVEILEDSLEMLNKKIKDKIYNLEEYGQVGQHLKFKSNELSSAERAMIHQYCETSHLTSKSTGKKKNRQLEITVERKRDYDETNKIIERKITDFSQFNAIKIIDQDGEELIRTKGKIMENQIYFYEGSPIKGKEIIILRGIPGFGKSNLAKMLIRKYGGIICSADEYFKHKKYDKTLIKKAHQYCYDKCIQSSKVNGLIVIDNINGNTDNYQKYIDLAHENEREVIILELICKNKEEAIELGKRSIHSVDIEYLRKTYLNWETDLDAYLLEPYIEEKKSKIID